MWLCRLPVLMDALTSVSQHCGEDRGRILVSQWDFPLQSGSTTREEANSHNSTVTKLQGAFRSTHLFRRFLISPAQTKLTVSEPCLVD